MAEDFVAEVWKYILMLLDVFQVPVLNTKAWQGGRVDNRSMKYRPSTWQGREDYSTVSKLYLAEREMKDCSMMIDK